VGQTKYFFKEKKEWSILKDTILDYYLTPYIAKILRTGKPLLIFDCFAGKGKFDGGEKGSPLIISDHIKNNLQKNPQLRDKIKGYFVEKKYYAELNNNLSGYPNISVLDGTFESNLQNILSSDKSSNVFLYVDPYGIKSLNLSNFDRIKDKNFFSLEMLMNFNSAGFLREGCRLLKYEELLKDEEVPDYESDEDVNTVDRMDAIAGGSYWQDILKEYYNRKINIYQAEDKFISEYSRMLKSIFKYTINIPIKVKLNHLPKYRLIFGTNHEDGLIVMADNMNKKWKQMLENQRGGQQVLFDIEFPDFTLMKGFDLHKDILSFVSAHKAGVDLKMLIVELIQKYGITFTESDYRKNILQIEQNSDLSIERIPSLTPTGKKAISMDYNRYKITVKKRI
jgi:three-Cys-motif partner protein